LSSTLYAPNKGLTAWKSIEILVDVSLATVISCYFLPFGPKKFLTINHLALGVLVLVLEVEALLNPPRAFRLYGLGVMRRQLGGIFPSMNPSMFGYVCAVVSAMSLVSLLFCTQSRERIFYAFLFSTSTIGCVLSHSRAAMIANALAILAVPIINRKRFIVILSLLLISATFFVPQARSYWLRTQTKEQVMVMTGRVSYYWPTALDAARKSPIYGHGFYSAQRTILNSDTTDNFFLDIFIGLGAIGVFVVVALILSVWKSVISLIITARREDSQEIMETASKLLAMLVVLSVVMVTTRGFAIHGDAFMIFMTVVICLQVFRHGKQDQVFAEE